MKLFFINEDMTELASVRSRVLARVRSELLKHPDVEESFSPGEADFVVMHERFSYKDFRYIDRLSKDRFLAGFLSKLFTINSDDAATGLLRGVYTSLPKSRFNSRLHASVPYMEYPNELVFSEIHRQVTPSYLGSWRGNTKSNVLRRRMIEELGGDPDFCFETTQSWLNHQTDEKSSYVDVMLKAKFSICPAGWAPVSFRIYESMAIGRCPLILADELVPPDGPDWSVCALFYPESKVAGIASFLRQHENRFLELGRNAKAAFDSHFHDSVVARYYADRLLSLMRSSEPTTAEREIKRWNSLALFWSNKWTLPQRVLNKAKKWAKVSEL